MKVYKVEVMVIDFDEIGEDELKLVIENTKYPNRCIYPEVKAVETREVEWREDHPLNMRDDAVRDAAYRQLFSPNAAGEPRDD